jgi:predicted DNA-binding antitoxin AbrB/MazE fold protein
MTATVTAIYGEGVLRLPGPLPLPGGTEVRVTIETAPAGDAERAAWLKQSEAALVRTWDNAVDDVFNELLTR